MKHILLALAIVGLVATSAHAGKIVSYNPSYGFQPRTLFQWAIGNQRLYVFTVESCVDGQRRFSVNSVWLNHFTGEVTVQVDRSVVVGSCP